MSYIPEVKTREEFVSSFKSERRRGVAKSSLKAFDLFCNEKYQKEGFTVLKDLVNEVKNRDKTEKIYVLLAQFADWLNMDHPNIIQRIGMNGSYKRIMSKVHPRTLRNYLGMVRNYFEDVGGIRYTILTMLPIIFFYQIFFTVLIICTYFFYSFFNFF